MLVAKGTIIADGKEYQKGQVVQGLSPASVKWMLEAGFLEEIKEPKKTGKKEEAVGDGAAGAAGK